MTDHDHCPKCGAELHQHKRPHEKAIERAIEALVSTTTATIVVLLLKLAGI